MKQIIIQHSNIKSVENTPQLGNKDLPILAAWVLS